MQVVYILRIINVKFGNVVDTECKATDLGLFMQSFHQALHRVEDGYNTYKLEIACEPASTTTTK